jgi:predicted DCC family thiol-disulfide oxidoreductase YuxK
MRHGISAARPHETVLDVPPRGGVLVFDGYCGFCTRAVRALLRADRRRRVRALPAQGKRVLDLTGLTREQAMHEAWWIGADGARRAGAAAMLAAVRAATGLPLPALYRVPGFGRLADRVYRWVADHRRLLPGTTPHCLADPAAACTSDGPAACGVRPVE